MTADLNGDQESGFERPVLSFLKGLGRHCFQTYPDACLLRYSAGEMPTARTKARRKVSTLAKPQSQAISFGEAMPDSSKVRAAVTRASMAQSAGVTPTSFLN